jgi:carboxypeptidase C (cathepsin A)
MANPDPYPPILEPYLNSEEVTSKIGSEGTVTWAMSNYDIVYQFNLTGDYIRSKSSYLETVINAGVRTVLYNGDADYICNYIGFEAMVRPSYFLLPLLLAFALTPSLHTQIASLDTSFSSEFAEQEFTTYTVNGETAGQYKNAGTFSYLRVYGAGHEVPAYEYQDVPRGAAALQMFTQIMSDQPLSST